MNTENDPCYSIQEISDRSGIPRRTIHFYVQQGVLPPPKGVGLAARYDDRHLTRLRLIPILRQQGLRLDQIRQRLNSACEEEIKELLRVPSPPASSTPFPRTFSHYALPGGGELVIPTALTPAQKEQVRQLIEAARAIFSETPVKNAIDDFINPSV